eukprot:1939314-Rhodomonas_salina.1
MGAAVVKVGWGNIKIQSLTSQQELEAEMEFGVQFRTLPSNSDQQRFLSPWRNSTTASIP